MLSEETLIGIIEALKAGAVPQAGPDEVPCFNREALEGAPMLHEEHLQWVLESLTYEDLPALERALQAMQAGERAWLGFKIVYDAEACMRPDDQSFDMGPSADDVCTVFFGNEEGELICSRPFNRRDAKQMSDVTRGPSMHTDQFAGVTWCSTPLFGTPRVVVFCASEVSACLARYAHDCGFDTLVLDDDPAFLNEERFPYSDRLLLASGYTDLSERLHLTSNDYCCVITRGHLHDIDALICAVNSPAGYVGMMGNPRKNAAVLEECERRGCSLEDLEHVYAPIGIKIAGSTSPEIAISIIAQLIDIRGTRQRG